MKYIPCALYDYTRNNISMITILKMEYSFGDMIMLNCAYTKDEYHYIFLGELRFTNVHF